MTAGAHNIKIEKGATFTLNITWKDANGVAIDITGYIARMQVRQSIDDTTKILDLSSVGGEIVLGDAAGTIVVTVTDTNTAAISEDGEAVYDLELESSGGVTTRLLEGNAEISKEVTR